MWEGVGDRTELQHIDLPTLMAIRVSFRSPGLLNRRPGGPTLLGAIFLYHILSPKSPISKLNRGFRGPLLLGAGFLYHFLSPTDLVSKLLNRGSQGPFCRVLAFSTTTFLQLVWPPKLTDFLSTPSYIIIQSPTQYLPIIGHRNVSLPPSLEWHVWSSSSGNNCQAVHRSLSPDASVCDCTKGFYLVPYCQPSLPTRFLPITGHRNVSLPLSLEWHVWPGRRSIYNNNQRKMII